MGFISNYQIYCVKNTQKIIHFFFYPRNIERDESRHYNIFIHELSQN